MQHSEVVRREATLFGVEEGRKKGREGGWEEGRKGKREDHRQQNEARGT
jgi:hypothetical protein